MQFKKYPYTPQIGYGVGGGRGGGGGGGVSKVQRKQTGISRGEEVKLKTFLGGGYGYFLVQHNTNLLTVFGKYSFLSADVIL